MLLGNLKTKRTKTHELICEGCLVRWEDKEFFVDMLYGDRAHIVRFKDLSLNNVKIEAHEVSVNNLKKIRCKTTYQLFLESVYMDYARAFHPYSADKWLRMIEPDTLIIIQETNCYEIGYVENVSSFLGYVQVCYPTDNLNIRAVVLEKNCISAESIHFWNRLKTEEVKEIILENDRKQGLII